MLEKMSLPGLFFAEIMVIALAQEFQLFSLVLFEELLKTVIFLLDRFSYLFLARKILLVPLQTIFY